MQFSSIGTELEPPDVCDSSGKAVTDMVTMERKRKEIY